MSRYNKRTVATNSNEQYKNLLEKRGVEKVKQYKTLEKEVLEQEVYDSVETFDYAWTYGDMYWKLSSRFYGDPQYWWVIASFNKKPTESHNKIGDTIKIPVSLADALQVVE
jgi:nucleoid-associated protein YgaU|tara:strand:+ start:409 stop:741 length:333 start_codon:yes stop_codon:yes gene_type:complete